MSNPKVSVLMGVYNEEKYISGAVDSILGQSMQDFEFIIIDDGSTDRTPELLEDYARKDARIRIITQANEGLTRALNRGIRICRGEYIARMDADNVSRNQRLMRQAGFLDMHPRVAMVGAWRVDVYPNNKRVVQRLPTADRDIKRDLVKKCVISHSSIMIRTAILRQYMYDTRYRTSQDYDLWIRLGKSHKLASLGEVLTEAYHRMESISRTKSRWETIRTYTGIQLRAYSSFRPPWWYFIYILRPLLSAFTPEIVKQRYNYLRWN